MRPTFTALRNAYPSTPHDCTMIFDNSCAIRLSEALAATDHDMINAFRTSGLNTCKHGFIRGAQDLASVLARRWGTRELGFDAQPNNETSPPAIRDLQGVICFMNIPAFSGQGHIDIWNRDHLIGSRRQYWKSNPIWFWRL